MLYDFQKYRNQHNTIHVVIHRFGKAVTIYDLKELLNMV
jgi:hypothetical protein